MSRFVRFQLPAVLWAVMLFVLSSLPQLPSAPKGPLSWDKLQHFGAYGTFGLLLVRAFGGAGWKPLVVGVLYGGADEIHQLFVPGRDCNLYDFVADTIGVLTSQIFVRALRGRKVIQTWEGTWPTC